AAAQAAPHPAPSAPPSPDGGGMEQASPPRHPSPAGGGVSAAGPPGGGAEAVPRTNRRGSALAPPPAPRRAPATPPPNGPPGRARRPPGGVTARGTARLRGGRALAPAPPGVPAAPAAAAAPIPAPSDEKIRALFPPDSYEVVPHDNMRKIIAQRLQQAKQTIPHFYLTIDCDIGKLTAAREEINAAAPKDKDGQPARKPLGHDFGIKALA